MIATILALALYATLLCVCGRFTAIYAAQRGRSRAFWFVLGCLFYPVPSLILALLPRRDVRAA